MSICWESNNNFTKEVTEGDIHLYNMKKVGLKDRDQAKTFIYAFIYGASSTKIGKILKLQYGLKTIF